MTLLKGMQGAFRSFRKELKKTFPVTAQPGQLCFAQGASDKIALQGLIKPKALDILKDIFSDSYSSKHIEIFLQALKKIYGYIGKNIEHETIIMNYPEQNTTEYFHKILSDNLPQVVNAISIWALKITDKDWVPILCYNCDKTLQFHFSYYVDRELPGGFFAALDQLGENNSLDTRLEIVYKAEKIEVKGDILHENRFAIHLLGLLNKTFAQNVKIAMCGEQFKLLKTFQALMTYFPEDMFRKDFAEYLADILKKIHSDPEMGRLKGITSGLKDYLQDYYKLHPSLEGEELKVICEIIKVQEERNLEGKYIDSDMLGLYADSIKADLNSFYMVDLHGLHDEELLLSVLPNLDLEGSLWDLDPSTLNWNYLRASVDLEGGGFTLDRFGNDEYERENDN